MHRTVRVAVCMYKDEPRGLQVSSVASALQVCRSMFLVKKRKASARSTKDDAVCLAKKLPFLAADTRFNPRPTTIFDDTRTSTGTDTGPCSLASERPSHLVSFEQPGTIKRVQATGLDLARASAPYPPRFS
ncbi:hypothetical protein V8C40DRAFT_233117, partial [Trichoderma camerunense]